MKVCNFCHRPETEVSINITGDGICICSECA